MKAFIFDLDGTLLDTIGDIGDACNTILKKHGIPTHEIPAYKQMVGNGFAMLVKRALPVESVKSFDALTLEKLIDETKKQYAENMMNFTRPYQGMDKILYALRQKDSAIAVLSNKPDSMTYALARHYFPEIDFAFIRGAIDGIPLKPNPASLLELISKHDLDKNQAFYIGDSDVDIKTGHNAGVKTVGACWGFRGREELENAKADILLAEPVDLLTL